MTRKEIYEKALSTFYKDLPEFLDTLRPDQLEKLELDLRRNLDDGTQPIGLLRKYIGIVKQAGERNCGDEYYQQ